MADAYSGPDYINIAIDEESDMIEVPAEDDGTLLLSVIQAHFPDALGLKYRSPAGAWRAVRISDSSIDPPHEGWSEEVRYVISVGQTAPSATSKRKHEETSDAEPPAKVRPEASGQSDTQSSIPQKKQRDDIIVLGLSREASEEDVRVYFEKYGAVQKVEIKKDRITGKPKGFGFVKFEDSSVASKALGSHTICSKECSVRTNVKKTVECKLFIGKLPTESTKNDMQQLFGAYGELTDVFVPQPGRGFGFITFKDKDDANVVLKREIRFKDRTLAVRLAQPKPEPEDRQRQDWEPPRDNRRPMYREDQHSARLEREYGIPGLVKLLANAENALRSRSPPRERRGDPRDFHRDTVGMVDRVDRGRAMEAPYRSRAMEAPYRGLDPRRSVMDEPRRIGMEPPQRGVMGAPRRGFMELPPRDVREAPRRAAIEDDIYDRQYSRR